MSIFDRFRPKPPVPRHDWHDSAKRRLTALRSYRDLSKAAQGLVKAVLLDHQPPFEACRAIPNGSRLFESQAVQRCLEQFGYPKPVRPKNDQNTAPIESATYDTPKSPGCDMSGPSENPGTGIPAPVQNAQNVTSTPPPTPPTCEVCGQPSSGSFYGRQLCPRHGAVSLTGTPVAEPATPAAVAPPTTAETPNHFPERDGRCRSCQLVICNCGRRDYSPPPAEVTLGQNGPVDVSDLFPGLTDFNKAVWAQQAAEEQESNYVRFLRTGEKQ